MSQPEVGQILYGNPQRDAIHIAICPAIAKNALKPGERVSIEIENGAVYAYPSNGDSVGIVDPFLEYGVREGSKFYIFLHPNTIRSLRHDWVCPQFEDKERSQTYMKQIARDLKWECQRLMDAAECWVQKEKYTYENNQRYESINIDWEDFWTHYEILTGKKPEIRVGFFTCSC